MAQRYRLISPRGGYRSAYEPGHFDVVWASPDCRMYSRARTTGGPRNFEKADCLVQACRDIIEYLQPNCWFIENPDSGLLKTRPCISGLSYVRVGYCMYGCPYRKRTRLWTKCTDWTGLSFQSTVSAVKMIWILPYADHWQ